MCCGAGRLQVLSPRELLANAVFGAFLYLYLPLFSSLSPVIDWSLLGLKLLSGAATILLYSLSNSRHLQPNEYTKEMYLLKSTRGVEVGQFYQISVLIQS